MFAEGAENVWIGDGLEDREEPTARFYAGTVAGEPESWVRVRIRDGVLDGMIRTAEDVYFIEPSSHFFTHAAANEMVAYRLSDTSSDWGPGSCALDQPAVGAEMSQHAGFHEIPEEYASLVAEPQQVMAESGTVMEAEIGLVADYELYLEHGANTATYLQNIVNHVSGILESEAGLKLKITQTVVHTNSNDPFSSTTSPSGLLNEFASYKGSPNSPVYDADLAHLFTDRNLDGSVIGVAWVGTLCNASYATGLSQDYTSDNKSMVLLTAHEIGHNLAAPYDNQSGSACASTPFGYIMNPWVSTSLNLQYSACSQSFIAAEMGSVNCLELVQEPEPTVPTLTVGSSTVAAGSSVTVTWSGIATPTGLDWLGLYPLGAGSSAYQAWVYTSCTTSPGSGSAAGSGAFSIPGGVATGTYELRLFTNNSYTEMVTSTSFSVF